MSLNQFEALPKNEQQLPQNPRVRCDTKTAVVVNQGIKLQSLIGTACALEYFQANRVPPHVICRVLVVGALHRQTQ
jgi:hypothetical protein